ncbi:hypothetical protein A9320_17775 [Ruegeria sp. PBVC088]|nr:hypothetical protein A9320_17775 [Ruegeria sp. PBVC088]
MTDKPILFSGPMVRALLDGRKTQTRRVLKRHVLHKPEPHSITYQDGTLICRWRSGIRHDLPSPYAIGDRLWVREAWATVNSGSGPGWAYRADSGFVQPDYDGEDFGAGPSFNYDKYPGEYCMWFSDLLAGEPGHPWRPSIHMPRWASRLTLIVTDVRVQRVQEISADDARAEGVQPVYDPASDTGDPAYMNYQKTGEAFAGLGAARLSFMTLWDSLNAPRGYGWDVNPWVAAYTFSIHRQNIDQMTDTLQQMRTT